MGIDGSRAVEISDLCYLVDYMFSVGPAPLVGFGEGLSELWPHREQSLNSIVLSHTVV